MKRYWTFSFLILGLSLAANAQQAHRSDYNIADFGAIGDGENMSG